MNLRRPSALGAAALLLASPAAHAVDGVFEINHHSVIAAGGYPFTIATPGSYVLTGSLTPPASTTALIVGPMPANVDIDLNGFSIIGSGGPGGDGIVVGIFREGVTIHDGVITGFGGSGIEATNSADLKVLKMRIGNNRNGIVGAFGCLIVENTIVGNERTGIEAGHCEIEKNVIDGNGEFGIAAIDSVIVHNVINGNGFGLGGGGVLSTEGGTIQENHITGNRYFGVSDKPGAPPGPVPAPPGIPFPPLSPPKSPQVVMKNVIDGSSGIGVYLVTSTAVISDNTVNGHVRDGIVCAGGCTVRGNTVSYNNTVGSSNGGITVGPGSTVNDNSVSFNTGIGAVLDPTAGYRNNTLNANTVQDMSVFVPAAPAAPHPTSGMGNLCSGVPGPAIGLCP